MSTPLPANAPVAAPVREGSSSPGGASADESLSAVRGRPLPGHPKARGMAVDREELLATCEDVHRRGGRLVSLWASDDRDRQAGFCVHVALEDANGLLVLRLPLAADAPAYPDLAGLFPTAGRLQRAAFDLSGVVAEANGGDGAAGGESVDLRPWLRHANWPADFFPLRHDTEAARVFPPAGEDYAFVRVEGDGVHEIPVGPVHAGIIEPGHFRFSIVGEKVLRLEERLGYVHKGIERRFTQLAPSQGQRLAARISGDSAVAYAWAYCQALEGLAGRLPPPRALALRALALERERLANHLGDLGALGNDCGFAFGLTHFLRLKEDLLRENAALFGARYLFDYVVPGGVAADLSAVAGQGVVVSAERLASELGELREIYDNHSGVQDRFLSAGRIPPELALRLGTTGMPARASGVDRDLRRDHPWAPYDRLAVRVAVRQNGDVATRVNVRFDEAQESLRLIRELAQALPVGAFQVALPPPAAGLGVGWIEGWRGPVLMALEIGDGGMAGEAAGATRSASPSIRRCHAHDPSWHNWPTLEHAIMGNIVPDFPLINKSFNLSYSGHDL